MAHLSRTLKGHELVEYDAVADALGSWQDAVAAMRERHLEVVSKRVPALWRIRSFSRTSRAALAEEIGVSEALLEEWELRRALPPPDLFYRWCDLLGA